MTSRTLLGIGLLAGLGACTVPSYEPSPFVDGDDTGSGDTAATADTDDTDVADTDDTDITWGDDTGDDDDQDLPGDLPDLGCHPYDPVEGTGWTRRYAATYGTDAGVEVHTGVGPDVIPRGWAGAVANGWAYEVSVTQAGSANGTGKYWRRCDMGDPGAYDIGWRRSTSGLGAVTLRAAPNTPLRYLPDELSLYGNPSWEVDGTYNLSQQGGIFPGGGSGDLVREADYVGFGFDTISVPAGTFDVYHVNVVYTEEQVSGGGVFDSFFGVFEDLFSSLLGIGGGETSVTAQSDLYYARGVGLVKEMTIDFTTGANIVTKELTNCSGLPECP